MFTGFSKRERPKRVKTLSDWCLGELRRSVQQPTWVEMRERLAQLPPLGVHDVGAVAIVRAERDRR